MTAHAAHAPPAPPALDLRAAILLEARKRLVEEVLAGSIDAERARAIFAGLAAHADAVAAFSPP
jgi:hypothetical protein